MPQTLGPTPLSKKTVLITGASSGIGWATAQAFSDKGANVVVTARREQRLRELSNQIAAHGGKAVYIVGDAAEESTAKACIELALKEFGRLDVLINNAGIGNYKNFIDTSAADYDELMNSNMRSGFVFTRHAAPVMLEQKSGEILFISSVAGLQGAAGESVYSATKFAQIGFAQSLDAELRKHGIKVGIICPGGVKSEFAVGRGRTEEGIQQSRMMDPREVADTIVFACMQPPNVRILQMTVRHMG